MSGSTPSQGIYFLANDHVYEWSVAFLESFRAHNPSLPLVLIPYNDAVARLAELAPHYRFQVWQDGTLEALDALGQSFAEEGRPGWVNMFRKFAVFWGPFTHGLYLDCDMVVLDDLSDVLRAFCGSTYDFAFFDETDEYVYNRPVFMEAMKQQYHARPFNAGYWCARTGVLTLERVRQAAEEAKTHRDEFYYGVDQAFLNYCVHTLGLSHGGLSDLLPDLAHHHWATRWRRVVSENGAYRVGHRESPDYGKRVKILHWAGYRISPVMPYRNIFLQYRLRQAGRVQALRYRFREALKYAGTRMLHDFAQGLRKGVKKVAHPLLKCTRRMCY